MPTAKWLIAPMLTLSAPALAEGEAKLPRAATPEASAEPNATPALKIETSGFVRVVAEVIENDDLPYVGRNDGFRLADARLEVAAARGEDLRGLVSIEGALSESDDRNDPNEKLSVGLKDAFLEYDFNRKMSFRVGRFKAPYDSSELQSTDERTFIDRSLESRGVRPTQGLETPGLSVGRQIGLMLHKPKMGYSTDGFDFGYAAALTNGRTGGLALNDNEAFAGFLRISTYFSDLLTLSLAGYIDSRSSGELPNLFEDRVIGAEASLAVHIADLTIEGQALLAQTAHVTSQAEDTMALGFHGSLAYDFWQMRAAYRFAWFDPNDRYDVDAVSEHTLSASFRPTDLPLVFTLEGTLPVEQRELKNSRIDALAQFSF